MNENGMRNLNDYDTLIDAAQYIDSLDVNYMDKFTIQLIALCVLPYVKDVDIDLRDFTPREMIDFMVERGPGVIIRDLI